MPPIFYFVVSFNAVHVRITKIIMRKSRANGNGFATFVQIAGSKIRSRKFHSEFSPDCPHRSPGSQQAPAAWLPQDFCYKDTSSSTFSDVVVHNNARQFSRELSPLFERDFPREINHDFGVTIFPAGMTDVDTCGESTSDSYVTDLVAGLSDATRVANGDSCQSSTPVFSLIYGAGRFSCWQWVSATAASSSWCDSRVRCV